MLEAAAPRWVLRWEPAFAVVLCAIAFAAIPISEGGIGLSWDFLNHHVYLGWTAEHQRFDQDFLAAGYQALQYPYLYWPVYKLATLGASGLVAGLVLAALQLAGVPAVWMIARRCVDGSKWLDVTLRAMAVVLAFATGAIVSLLDVTSNDLMAAIPMVWAIALALEAIHAQTAGTRFPAAWVAVSGLLAGIAFAFKFSNGPIAILLPVLWAFSARNFALRLRNVIIGSAAVPSGVTLAYGYWGMLLWQHFGNPIYPFYDALFAPLRAWLGWSG
jgi:hypothetical protein